MQTKGQYRVGIDFNPSGSGYVNEIKRAAADLIDLIEEATAGKLDDATLNPETCGEIRRLTALAQTSIEEAAMWAVKAATKGDRR